jgi:hypothetical protein
MFCLSSSAKGERPADLVPEEEGAFLAAPFLLQRYNILLTTMAGSPVYFALAIPGEDHLLPRGARRDKGRIPCGRGLCIPQALNSCLGEISQLLSVFGVMSGLRYDHLRKSSDMP